MKKFVLLLSTALLAGACSEDAVAPSESLEAFDASAVLAYDPAGRSDAGRYLTRLHRLPDGLKLTAAQEEQIRSLLERFAAAIKPDVEALRAVMRRVEEARNAGKSREEIARILAQAREIRVRLEAAEAALAAAIREVLTAEQKAWLAANEPKRCDPRTAPPLSEEQRTEIRALVAAFEEANLADLRTVKEGLERARLAQRNGASRERVKAILDSIKPAVERLAAARAELLRAIDALLTPEQRASGCYRGLPGR